MNSKQNVVGADSMALAMRGGAVGANLGFRRAHEMCSAEELAAIADGEARVLRFGRIMNGAEPGFQNGFSRLGGFSRAACRPVSLGQWEARKAKVLARARVLLADRREARAAMRAALLEV